MAPSGMGKKTVLIAMLLGPYRGIVVSAHVLFPSIDIDSAWMPGKEQEAGLEGSSFHSEWCEKAVKTILDDQRDTIKGLKAAKTTKVLPRGLTIIEDFADRQDIVHSAFGVLTMLFIRGLHFGPSCWLSSQKLTDVSTVARINFRFVPCGIKKKSSR